MKNVRGISFYIIIFVIMTLIIMMYSNISNPTDMKYSDFRKELDAGNVSNVLVRTLNADVVLIRPSGLYNADFRYTVNFLSQESFIALLDNAYDRAY